MVTTQYLHLLYKVGEHDNGSSIVVPDESPEVSHGVRERTLCCNVLIATIVTLRIWRESMCEMCGVWREMCEGDVCEVRYLYTSSYT